MNGKRTILVVNKTDIESADFQSRCDRPFRRRDHPFTGCQGSLALTGSGIETPGTQSANGAFRTRAPRPG
ncbi:MAG: hypothetical protein MZV70_28460 [Desulfobacterales bacterium]|nr:hypothetical protein [Desulfobacterales bacterium]